MGNIAARQSTAAQSATVSRILQKGGESNLAELQSLPADQQKAAIIKIIAAYRQKAAESPDPAEKAKFNALAKQLEQRLTVIDRLLSQKKAAESLPHGGLRYMCSATQGENKNNFLFTCKPYEAVAPVAAPVATPVATPVSAPVAAPVAAPAEPEEPAAVPVPSREYYSNAYY